MKKLFVIIFLAFAFGVEAQTIDPPSDYTDHYGIRLYAQGARAGADALNQNSITIDSAIWGVHVRTLALEGTEINGHALEDGNITISLTSLGIDTVDLGGTTNASDLTSGTLPDARLSGNVAMRNARNQFTWQQTFDSNAVFSKGITVTGNATVSGTVSGTLSGNGSAITNLNASNITTGTIDGARITGYLPSADSVRFALRSYAINGQALSGNVTITKAMLGIDTTNYLNASNISTGTLSSARLQDSVWTKARLDTSGYWNKTTLDTNDFFTYSHPDTNYVDVNDFKVGDVIQVVDNGSGGKIYSALNLGEKSMVTNNIPLDSGAIFRKTLNTGTSTSITMSGFAGSNRGKAFSVILYNSTALTHTLSWVNPSAYTIVWSGGVAPTTIASAKRDVYTFLIAGNTIFGSVIQNFNP